MQVCRIACTEFNAQVLPNFGWTAHAFILTLEKSHALVYKNIFTSVMSAGETYYLRFLGQLFL